MGPAPVPLADSFRQPAFVEIMVVVPGSAKTSNVAGPLSIVLDRYLPADVSSRDRHVPAVGRSVETCGPRFEIGLDREPFQIRPQMPALRKREIDRDQEPGAIRGPLEPESRVPDAAFKLVFASGEILRVEFLLRLVDDLSVNEIGERHRRETEVHPRDYAPVVIAGIVIPG